MGETVSPGRGSKYSARDSVFPSDLEDFFSEFLPSREETARFVESAVRSSDSAPRKMVNTVKRMVSLADDTEGIRPGRDSVKIVFLVTALESLYHLAGSQKSKADMVRHFFQSGMPQPKRELILAKVTRVKDSSGPPAEGIPISMEEFADIILEVRNTFAHEGIYWGFSFGRRLNTLPVRGESRAYEVNLTFGEFRKALVAGMINHVSSYISRGSQV